MTLYFDSKEILSNKSDLKKRHEGHTSYFLRSGKIFSMVNQFKKESVVLELGCGAGQLTESLYQAGYKNLDFVDIDDYLAFEDVKSLQRLKLVDLNSHALPYPDESFDLVLAIAIVEHLENPHLVEREIARVLKTGGTLIMSLPHAFNLISRFKFFFQGNVSGYNLKNNHINFQTKDVFAKCWLADFNLNQVLISPGHIKLFGLSRLKIRLPDSRLLNEWFGRSICYILKKNSLDHL